MSYNKYRVAAKADRTCDGIVFDSKTEMQRYLELRLALRGRAIKSLKLQPRYPLVAGIVYVADFEVEDVDGIHAEDVKGFATTAFNMKRRLWKEFGPHPLVILKRSGKTWKREVVTTEKRND